jgi:hypothetical protein
MSGQTDDMTQHGHEFDEATPEEHEASVEAQDINDDGKVSIVEEWRSEAGIVDARLEQISHEGGVKGTLAKAAHEILDKLDND